MSDRTGIVLDMPETDYHAHPALSSTGARRLLESPARFQYERTHAQPPKAAFDLGHAVHAKVLGVGAEVAVIPDEILAANGAVSTKAAKEFIGEARAAGLVPIKSAVADEVNAMAESVLAHPTASLLLAQAGSPEASVFATDPDTEVEMRARFDFLATGGRTPVAVDLKTAADASPAGFAKAAASHGYHVQRGHYLDTYQFAGGDPLEGFAFVVVETTAPYLVAVYRLNTEWEDIGLAQAREARTTYRQCLDTNTWPGYGDDIQSLMAPFWLIAEYQESL